MSRGKTLRRTAAGASALAAAAERLPRPVWWLLWSVVLVPPFVFLPTADEVFRLPKLMVAETLGLASLLGLAWAGRLRHLVDWRRRPPALLAVLPLTAISSASLLWTDHPAITARGLADLWIGAACLVGWSVGLRRREARALLAGLAGPAALVALLAALQWHDVWRPLGIVEARQGLRTQVTSLAGNPADLAGFLLLPGLFLQARVILEPGAAERRRARWWLAAAALALVLYGLFITQTLAALAAFAAASAVLWALSLPRRHVLVAFAAAALGGTLLVATMPALRHRLSEKAGLLAAGNFNAVLSNRFDGWRAAGWMMARSPLLGVGFASYSSHFAAAKLDLLERGERFGPAHLHHFGNAHNDVLEVGAELGLLGLAALGSGLVVLARTAVALPRADRPLAAAGLVGFSVLALAQFPFELAITAYPAVLLLSWVFAGATDAPA